MTTVKFEGCKYLDYDTEKYDKRLKLVALPVSLGVYWQRPQELCNGLNMDVQFCAKRGRLNSKVACLKDAGFECSSGEMTTHIVEVSDEL